MSPKRQPALTGGEQVARYGNGDGHQRPRSDCLEYPRGYQQLEVWELDAGRDLEGEHRLQVGNDARRRRSRP